MLLSALVSSLAIIGAHASFENDPRCSAQPLRNPKNAYIPLRRISCTFKGINDTVLLPKTYSDMQVEIFGGSGGASLDGENMANPDTRGLGVYAKVRIANNFKDKILKIHPGKNGHDALIEGEPYRAVGGHDNGGKPGECIGSPKDIKQGATGGSASSVVLYDASELFAHELPYAAVVTVGAGGGAGGYIGNKPSRGGDGAVLIPNQRPNFDNSLLRHHLLAKGQGNIVQLANLVDGGHGLPHSSGGKGGGLFRYQQRVSRKSVSREGHPGKGGSICVAAGGAGAGYNAGVGGRSAVSNGTFGNALDDGLTAGGGGGGASLFDGYIYDFDQENPDYRKAERAFELVESRNIYDVDPRIVWTFTMEGW